MSAVEKREGFDGWSAVMERAKVHKILLRLKTNYDRAGYINKSTLQKEENRLIFPYAEGKFVSNLLPELVEEFYEKLAQFDGSIQREINFPSVPHKIKVAIGMRRTGKTYLLLQKIKNLLTQNPKLLKQILYLNFEDDRLLPLSAQKLGELLDDFYSLYPENHYQKCYFILDEIQNVPQWEVVIRRFFDTKKLDIYLTGSSAKLLSKEIATSLRGRSIATEVWPFNFREYLTANKIPFPQKPFGKISRDQMLKQLNAYLIKGGFPEVVTLDTLDRNRILQDYVDVVIFRDIIERHKVVNTPLIKYLIKTLIKQAGSTFSVNKFFNDLKSQGMNVSKMTIYDYLSYLEDAYLVFSVPLYSESIRKSQINPKKIYIIDPGLINAYVSHSSSNIGHLFENLVYIELKRRGFEVYYYLTEKDRYEVDFLVKDSNHNWHLYQVAWDVTDPDTYAREKRALELAERELKIKGEIITPEVFLDWI